MCNKFNVSWIQINLMYHGYRYTDGADDQDHSSRPSRRTGVEKTDLHPDALHQLMTDLYAHEESWPFLKPVNKKKVSSTLFGSV